MHLGDGLRGFIGAAEAHEAKALAEEVVQSVRHEVVQARAKEVGDRWRVRFGQGSCEELSPPAELDVGGMGVYVGM